MTTGGAWSSSPPSSWDGSDHHADSHFSLIIFPGGKLLLTTPDGIAQEDQLKIQVIMQEWLNSEIPFPLVIGNCIVQMTNVPPNRFEVQ